MENEKPNDDQKDDYYPQWKDMPEPRELLTATWQGAYDATIDATQGLYGRKPTRKEVVDVFNMFIDQGIAHDEGDFKSILSCVCDYFDCTPGDF